MLSSRRVSYIILTMDLHLTTITHEQVMPDILALFDITKPTMPRAFNVRILPATLFNINYLAGSDLIRRNIDLAPIYLDVAVIY